MPARQPPAPEKKKMAAAAQSAPIAILRPRAKQDFTASLGMIVFLASWAMMFSALFFAYAFVRSRSVVWPPPGAPALPIALPAVNTFVMLASSLTFARALAELARGRRRALTAWVAATLVLGLVFVSLQAVVWRTVARAGLSVASGIYGSAFYVMTAFHGLHVVVGLGILCWMLV